jgi:hypothetical protein
MFLSAGQFKQGNPESYPNNKQIASFADLADRKTKLFPFPTLVFPCFAKTLFLFYCRPIISRTSDSAIPARKLNIIKK